MRYLFSLTIPLFYRRIEGKNIKHLFKKGPVIVALNHPNSFMDSVCFTYVNYPLRMRYMARGDAFKPGLVTFLLDQIGIVPIYRLKDGGRDGLEKNNESYKRINQLLKRNVKIGIFAEGLCVQERRLRPLKKGVSRMVFGAYEYLNNTDLVVLPVGINYSNPSKFRSNLFYNVGEPIKVKDFIDAYNENQARGHNQFLQALDSKMKALITHIEDKKNDTLVVELEEMVMKSWLKKKHLKPTLQNQFTVSSLLTSIINNLTKTDEEKRNDLAKKTRAYFHLLNKHNLRDWLIDPVNKQQVSPGHLFLRKLIIVLLTPFHAIGYIAAYLPYKLSIFLTNRLIKGDKVFYASIVLGLGTFLLFFNFMIWFFLIYAFSPNVLWPMCLTLLLMGCARFSLSFHYFIKKTKGMNRIIGNKPLMTELREKRKEITDIMNGLTNF